MCWLKGKESIFLVLVAVTLSTCPTWTLAQTTLFDLLNRQADIKDFAKLANQSQYLLTALPYRTVTLFAPTNAAVADFQRNGGRLDNYTLMYHLVNLAMKKEELGDSVLSDLPGNSPIWVSRRNGDIYVNDAKIIQGHVAGKNSYGGDQYLYTIDRVLEPTLPTQAANRLFNPDARRFLEEHSQYSVTGNIQLSAFATRVVQVKQAELLQNSGKHTFFIPIDESLQKESVRQAISDKVVAGHVIPNQAIFLRLAEPGKEFDTVALSTDLKVLVSIENRTGAEAGNTWIVTSNTRLADAGHRAGLVQTDIVKGNIPVKNGVVHLIRKPLVIIDETVHQTLLTFSDLEKGKEDKNESESSSLESDEFFDRERVGEKQNGGLTQEFVSVFRDKARDIFDDLSRGNQTTTVFVPTNEAILAVQDSLNKMDVKQLQDILKLHIVKGFISTDVILDRHINASEHYQVDSLAGKKLLLNYAEGETRTFYVEGRGVNATIIKPNIAATDGVIHLINKVLGFADVSVYEKLRTDPMLEETFRLTSQDNFNEMFRNKDQKFTIFAPTNEAWNQFKYVAPSEHKKLMSGNFGYHVQVIFRRHLIVGHVLTIEDLYRNYSNGYLPVVSDKVEIKYRNETGSGRFSIDPSPRQRISSNYEYVLFWNYQHARVLRPNINCTNGIIHVIDNVLMRPEDVTVASGGSSLQSMFISLLTCSLMTMLLLN